MAAALEELAPGWYPDPDGEMLYRYWDGEAWTEQVADVPAAKRDRFIAQRKSMRYHGVSDFGDQTGKTASPALVLGILAALGVLAAVGYVLATGA